MGGLFAITILAFALMTGLSVPAMLGTAEAAKPILPGQSLRR
jgi:hypothetical protein